MIDSPNYVGVETIPPVKPELCVRLVNIDQPNNPNYEIPYWCPVDKKVKYRG
jgi:hypothetical protein